MKKGLLQLMSVILLASALIPVGFTNYCSSPIFAAGNRLYVDIDAVGLNDGTSWPNAFIDLQDALATALPGDEVWVANGTYMPTEGTDRGIAFQLLDGVAIYGGFTGVESSLLQRNWLINSTVLSGDIGSIEDISDNSYNVLTGSGCSDTAIIDGFIITGGNATDGYDGGGMYNSGGSPTVRNCSFKGNSAKSDEGGAVFNISSSNPTFINCTFVENAADQGGGMLNNGSSPLLLGCVFYGNIARIGGGIANFNGSNPTLINCTFSGNSNADDEYGYGGGMLTAASGATLTNCIFWWNESLNGAQLVVDNSTLAIDYCCIPQSSGNITYYGTGAIVWGSGNIDLDPQFVDYLGLDGTAGTEDDNLRLSAISPCIDVGNNTAVPSEFIIDLDRLPRIENSIVDMGAYEFRSVSTLCTLTINTVGNGIVLKDPDQAVYTCGTDVTLTAFPDPGWSFSNWSGDLTGNANPVTITMNDDKIVTAVYTENIQAELDFAPSALNLKSRGKFVTAYIELPEGWDVSDIDLSNVKLNDSVPALLSPTEIGDYNTNGIPDLMVKFSRSDLQSILSPGDDVEIEITGQVNGTKFEGIDSIKVI